MTHGKIANKYTPIEFIGDVIATHYDVHENGSSVNVKCNSKEYVIVTINEPFKMTITEIK